MNVDFATKAGLGAAIAVGFALLAFRSTPETRGCGAGFARAGARCMPEPGTCPAPLVLREGTCVPPDSRVAIAAANIDLGSDDWEAEGARPSREARVAAFAIDAFEGSMATFHCATCPFPDAARLAGGDAARAKGGVSFSEAGTYCEKRGGRLPTEHEWILAARSRKSGAGSARYPWGETGAVCRRAAWGFVAVAARGIGACGGPAEGSDTVGAHESGSTELGIFDLAGNVAEWATTPSGPIVKGGSYLSNVASELRVWWRGAVAPEAREPWVGVRCVYDVR